MLPQLRISQSELIILARETIYVLAAIAGIFGLLTYMFEAGDRRSQREMRSLDLFLRCQELLADKALVLPANNAGRPVAERSTIIDAADNTVEVRATSGAALNANKICAKYTRHVSFRLEGNARNLNPAYFKFELSDDADK